VLCPLSVSSTDGETTRPSEMERSDMTVTTFRPHLIHRARAFLTAFLVTWFAMAAVAQEALRPADSFQSTGDEIEGWFWLRDPGLWASAEYEFLELPAEGDIVLLIDALATDRASGGPGFPGTFDLLFGFPGSGMMGGVFNRI